MDHITPSLTKPPLVKFFTVDETNVAIARKIRKVLTMLQDERVKCIERGEQTRASIKTIDIAKNFVQGLAAILSGLTAILIGTSTGPVSSIVTASITGLSTLTNTSLNQLVRIRRWPQRVTTAQSTIQRLDMMIRICSTLKNDVHALQVLSFVQKEFEVLTNRVPLDSVVVMTDTDSGNSNEREEISL